MCQADPYEEGRKAYRDGVHIKRCPYKGTKAQVVARVDWLRGFAAQAKSEASEALAIWRADSDEANSVPG